jgi:predicted RNA-binding protein with PUA-like domain
MNFWLMKTEPNVYSIDDLKAEKQGCWEGVRNYQARNIMRDDMKVEDLVLFYHSNAKPPGVIGIARVAREGYPDHFQFDKKSKYFDKKADPKNPRWIMVDVSYVETFAEIISLDRLKTEAKLEGMPVIVKGQRLSIQPVEKKHFKHVLKMACAKTKV